MLLLRSALSVKICLQAGQMKKGESPAIQCLGLWHCKFALFFEMALTQFCLHVLHMWKDDNQVDGRLPEGLCRLPEGLRVFQVQ
jgi:hypothetical protein